MAELGKKFVLQGGTQHNLAALKAQVDYIKARVPGAEVFVHPHTGEAGAIGAAMETRRVVMRKGFSTPRLATPQLVVIFIDLVEEEVIVVFGDGADARVVGGKRR